MGYFYSTLYWRHIFGYLITVAANYICYKGLEIHGEILDGGNDLNLGGLVSYQFDVLYVNAFVLVGTALISDYLWIVYLVIPSFAGFKIYKEFIRPWLDTRAAMNSASDEGKQKKQQPKVKYVRK